MNRRTLITAGAVAAGAALVPGAIWLAVRNQEKNAPAEVADTTLLDILSDLVIPQTDTPGALTIGVPAFVRLAIEHGLGGAKPEDLQRLESELDRQAGSPFMKLERERQAEVLAACDAAAYSTGVQLVSERKPAWPSIKNLILLGYYTSEEGATQELHYQLVPGRFDSNIPLGPDDRAWASDWVAVS